MDLLNSKTNKSQRESTDCQLEYKPHNQNVELGDIMADRNTEAKD
jgi:hypothetical protein